MSEPVVDVERYWQRKLKPGTLLWGKHMCRFALVLNHEVQSFPSSWIQHRVCVLIDDRIRHIDQEHGAFLNAWDIIDVG